VIAGGVGGDEESWSEAGLQNNGNGRLSRHGVDACRLVVNPASVADQLDRLELPTCFAALRLLSRSRMKNGEELTDRDADPRCDHNTRRVIRLSLPYGEASTVRARLVTEAGVPVEASPLYRVETGWAFTICHECAGVARAFHLPLNPSGVTRQVAGPGAEPGPRKRRTSGGGTRQ
jgi:hypothetical protein